MADDADRAKVFETQHRNAALKATLERKPKEKPILVYGIPSCRECLEPIPEERLNAVPDAARCIECEQLKEEER